MSRKYQKKNPIEHCLLRPDMYVGSKRLKKQFDYIANITDEGSFNIINKEITYSAAVLRVFIEALSNAIDNVERSKSSDTPCTTIKVTIDQESGETKVWNDGLVVPIEQHDEENCYIHSMIFGQLLTGENYDDDEERTVSGRNGLGIKLANIYSKEFTVKGVDPVKQKMLTQKWTNNMRETKGAVVKASKLKKGYTEVSWKPDFEWFGLKNGYTRDIISLYTRFVIDAAMLSKVKVYFNSKKVNVNNLEGYSKLYENSSNEKLVLKSVDSEVLLTSSESPELEVISFVNGVYTRLGGQHVDDWTETIFRPIIEKTNKKYKSKGIKLNIADIKKYFRIFVVSVVNKPEFNGQEKHRLESPGVKTNITTANVNKIFKWSFIEKIQDLVRLKELSNIKKSEKRDKRVKIEGLDRANKAGTKDSHQCSLFICEGLSAKTYVVAGIQKGVYGKKGRDWFGVLPVTGKILNVRNASVKSIMGNKVVLKIIQTLGLKQGVDYTIESNYKTLNYGKVIIIADADVDGIHIEGLIINFIHTLYPSLLNRESPFVVSMKTPIARVIKKSKDQLFYDERNFVEWLENQKSKVNIKYYKGLGTTKPSDVPDTFGLKMVEYKRDEMTDKNLNKIFDKNSADLRKTWLEQYNPDNVIFSLDSVDKVCNLSISNFVDGEMIKFSMADCNRSIPNLIDGLKESQRKLLYAIKKRNLKYSGKSLKVAQLAGYTAEHSNYHHGEKNLFDTIIGMANEFPGTNNIPLLYRDGMFGTRLEGGKDAADGRYIFTKMEYLTEYIFKEEDEPLLKQVNDDGDFVQPEFYVPIIPMILVNGCTAGIGTGWSSSIPCYNPMDITNAIKIWLDNGNSCVKTSQDGAGEEVVIPELNPWYRGFNGVIEKDVNNDKRYVSRGIITQEKKDNFEISELPIGVWTDKFKDFCEDLRIEKKIKDMKNYSTPRDVKFKIKCADKFATLENFKLHSYIYESNMVLFDETNKIVKNESVNDILDSFCKVRYHYYQLRKKLQVKLIKQKLKTLNNKHKFIQQVIDRKLDVMFRNEADIIQDLESKNYDKQDDSYNYLLSLQIRTFTREKIATLKQEIKDLENKLYYLLKITEKQMWLRDLQTFEEAYRKFLELV